MDAPVMDVNIQAQQIFSDKNGASAYYDTISPDLLGENGVVRMTKSGKSFQVELPDELKLRGSVGTIWKHLENSSISQKEGKKSALERSLSQVGHSISENLIEYEGMKKDLQWKSTDDGRAQEFFEQLNRHTESTSVENTAMMERIMNQLQEGVAKTDESIRTKPYYYFVSDSNELNAYSTYNRIIIANDGLFDNVKDENEIAALLAHEIAHGEKKHMERTVDSQAGIILGMSMLGMKNDEGLVDAVIDKVNKEGLAMGMERQADDISFQYMIDAGYNPGATAALHQRFQDLGYTGDYKSHPLANVVRPVDHPFSIERRDNFVKKLVNYSNGHATVKDGVIMIDGQELCKPSEFVEKSGAERAYLALGNLATAYHNGTDGMSAYIKDGKLMLGPYEIMPCVKLDKSAQELANRLNQIRSKGIDEKFSKEGTTLFQAGVKVPSQELGDTKETIASIGNTDELSRFSYMKQFNVNGREVKPNRILDGEKQQSVLINFSEKSKHIYDQISNINIYGKDKKEIGQQVGKSLAELLEDNNSVEFFRVMQKGAEQTSQKIDKGIIGFVAETNKYNSGKYQDVDNYYGSYKESADEMIDVLRVLENVDLKENSRMNLGDNHIFQGLGNRETPALAKSFAMLNQNPEFQKGLQDELAKHPKALENYKEIREIQQNVLSKIEGLRIHAFDSNVKINSSNVKKLEKDFETIKIQMKESPENLSQKVSDYKENGRRYAVRHDLEKYFKKVSNMDKALSQSSEVLDNLMQTYPTAENLNQKKQIEADKAIISQIKDTIYQDKNWGAIAKKVTSERSSLEIMPPVIKNNNEETHTISQEGIMPKFSFNNPKYKKISLQKDREQRILNKEEGCMGR